MKDQETNAAADRVPVLSVSDVMRLMRTRMEGTWFDPRGVHRADVGAGSGHSAYRWRPLIWHSSAAANGGEEALTNEMAPSGETLEYVNERTVATQQTSWNFVAASRPWLPKPVAAIQWWAPDDSATSLRVPIYGGATKVRSRIKILRSSKVIYDGLQATCFSFVLFFQLFQKWAWRIDHTTLRYPFISRTRRVRFPRQRLRRGGELHVTPSAAAFSHA